jgi:hypothetical protein
LAKPHKIHRLLLFILPVSSSSWRFPDSASFSQILMPQRLERRPFKSAPSCRKLIASTFDPQRSPMPCALGCRSALTSPSQLFLSGLFWLFLCPPGSSEAYRSISISRSDFVFSAPFIVRYPQKPILFFVHFFICQHPFFPLIILQNCFQKVRAAIRFF